jgi:hypothetical protein
VQPDVVVGHDAADVRLAPAQLLGPGGEDLDGQGDLIVRRRRGVRVAIEAEVQGRVVTASCSPYDLVERRLLLPCGCPVLAGGLVLQGRVIVDRRVVAEAGRLLVDGERLVLRLVVGARRVVDDDVLYLAQRALLAGGHGVLLTAARRGT